MPWLTFPPYQGHYLYIICALFIDKMHCHPQGVYYLYFICNPMCWQKHCHPQWVHYLYFICSPYVDKMHCHPQRVHYSYIICTPMCSCCVQHTADADKHWKPPRGVVRTDRDDATGQGRGRRKGGFNTCHFSEYQNLPPVRVYHAITVVSLIQKVTFFQLILTYYKNCTNNKRSFQWCYFNLPCFVGCI